MITELGGRKLQIGIDSFAAAYTDDSLAVSASDRLRNLVEQIEHADQVGLDVFGIGEHHRQEYLDSTPRGHPRSGGANAAHPSNERYNGSELSRPGTGVSKLS